MPIPNEYVFTTNPTEDTPLSTDLKASGYQQGQVITAGEYNRVMSLTRQWLDYLEEEIDGHKDRLETLETFQTSAVNDISTLQTFQTSAVTRMDEIENTKLALHQKQYLFNDYNNSANMHGSHISINPYSAQNLRDIPHPGSAYPNCESAYNAIVQQYDADILAANFFNDRFTVGGIRNILNEKELFERLQRDLFSELFNLDNNANPHSVTLEKKQADTLIEIDLKCNFQHGHTATTGDSPNTTSTHSLFELQDGTASLYNTPNEHEFYSQVGFLEYNVSGGKETNGLIFKLPIHSAYEFTHPTRRRAGFYSNYITDANNLIAFHPNPIAGEDAASSVNNFVITNHANNRFAKDAEIYKNTHVRQSFPSVNNTVDRSSNGDFLEQIYYSIDSKIYIKNVATGNFKISLDKWLPQFVPNAAGNGLTITSFRTNRITGVQTARKFDSLFINVREVRTDLAHTVG